METADEVYAKAGEDDPRQRNGHVIDGSKWMGLQVK